MKGKPAMTLLHLGPGLGNGIANLHNARRAHTPLVNIIGEHASWHRPMDPPLTMDIEGLAKTVSAWVRTNASAQGLPGDMVDAIKAASIGGIASLIVPHDYQLGACQTQTPAFTKSPFDPPDSQEIEAAAQLLKTGKKTALLLGGRALRQQGLAIAARIKGMIGCDLLAETFPAVMEQGIGLAAVKRVPYFPKRALPMLAEYDGVVLAGAKDPVTSFGYPGVRSRMLRDDQPIAAIGTGQQDLLEALAALAEMLKAGNKGVLNQAADARSDRTPIPEGALTPAAACQTVAALEPEGAIIVDEGLTTSADYYALAPSLPPHAILTLTGGAIGYGMPCALGASLACPDRPVINFQADGSAMYTMQALWSQAREGANITTLICSNRSYVTLLVELHKAGVKTLGENAQALTALTNPPLDWVNCARGLGVPAVAVRDCAGLADALKRSFAEPGPSLIEMILAAR
jgi:acetolactate synthase-1/2/3 large subunit